MAIFHQIYDQIINKKSEIFIVVFCSNLQDV